MTTAAEPVPQFPERTWLDRLLSLASDVRAGEAVTALLLAANGFLILCAYYVIRPVRSGLLNPVTINVPVYGRMPGNEIESYLGAVLAGLFLFLVPLYSTVASKFNRVRLINGVTLFFVSNLALFFFFGAVAQAPAAPVAISFYLWIGIFNLMVIAQFWSFANDIYTPDEGKRLFAIVGFGGSLGAIAGAWMNRRLVPTTGPFAMMLLAGLLLLVCLVLTNIVHTREKTRAANRTRRDEVEKPLSRAGGFNLVLGQRYLLLIGLLTLAIQWVNTNGNYLLSTTLLETARASVAAGTSGGLSERDLITTFRADMDFWQNVLVVAIQFFLVSRIFKYLGVAGALFIMPMLALGSYGLFAAAPVLALIRVAKIAENASDYSLQNTLRRALFLPTSREAKYKALNAVETFFWRAGDMLSAVTTLVVVRMLGLGVRSYAAVNLGIVAIWIVVTVALSRENRRLMGEAAPGADAGHPI